MKKKSRHLTSVQLLYTLRSISDNDCMFEDFLDDGILQEFLVTVLDYDIVFIASDERILLTPYGEKILQMLTTTVDFGFENSKVFKHEYNK